MDAYYPADKEMVAKLTPKQSREFGDWMANLEAVMDEWKAKHGVRPYGDEPLSTATGLECWKTAFDDGKSPQEAFDEDRDCWE